MDPRTTRRDILRGGLALSGASAVQKTLPSVLGPITAGRLGVTLPHEHPAARWDWRRYGIYGPAAGTLTEEQRQEQHHALLSFWDLLGAELKRNRVRTIVDARPEHAGRDVGLLRELSQRTGLNILCSTGYYLSNLRPPDFVSRGIEAAQTYITRELTEGMGDTGVRAAVIKVAVGGRAGDESDDLLLKAAARAQKATGAPITTHATTPESRRNLVEILEKNGADLSRVAIGHADSNGTAEESAELLARGVYVLYTIWGITNPKLIGVRGPVAPDHSARLIRSLLDRGLVKQIMFSIDSSVYMHAGGVVLRLYDIPERTSNYIFTFVLPQLRKMGVSRSEIRQMMEHNPRRHLFGL